MSATTFHFFSTYCTIQVVADPLYSMTEHMKDLVHEERSLQSHQSAFQFPRSTWRLLGINWVFLDSEVSPISNQSRLDSKWIFVPNSKNSFWIIFCQDIPEITSAENGTDRWTTSKQCLYAGDRFSFFILQQQAEMCKWAATWQVQAWRSNILSLHC